MTFFAATNLSLNSTLLASSMGSCYLAQATEGFSQLNGVETWDPTVTQFVSAHGDENTGGGGTRPHIYPTWRAQADLRHLRNEASSSSFDRLYEDGFDMREREEGIPYRQWLGSLAQFVPILGLAFGQTESNRVRGALSVVSSIFTSELASFGYLHLYDLLKNSESSVYRQAACLVLGELLTHQIGVLQESQDDPDPEVREAAREAFNRIREAIGRSEGPYR